MEATFTLFLKALKSLRTIIFWVVFLGLAAFHILIRTHETNYEQFNHKLQSGETGAILLNFTHIENESDPLRLRMQNTLNGRIHSLRFTSEYKAIRLPPGSYKIVSGHTGRGQFNGTTPFVGLLFQDFQVRLGEISNLGILGCEPINAENKRHREHQKVCYNFNIAPGDSLGLNRYMLENFPHNQHRLVSRQLELRVSNIDFQQMYIKANKPLENGQFLTTRHIVGRMQEQLECYSEEPPISN